jgi:hypothetical protein
MMKQLFSQSGDHLVPGTWKLAPGRAMTLSPHEPGLLEVVYGEVWATFDGPHSGPPNDLGDHVVRAGERLCIPAGQHLVVESWRAEAPAFLNWDPSRSPVASPRGVTAQAASCAAS